MRQLINNIQSHVARPDLRRTVFALVDNAILGFSAFFLVVYYARTVARDEYGVLVLFVTIRNYLVLFPGAVAQALVQDVASSNKRNLTTNLSNPLVLVCVYMLLVSVLVFTGSQTLAGILHAAKLSSLLRWMPVALAVRVLDLLISRLNIGYGRMGVVVCQDTVSTIVFIASSIGYLISMRTLSSSVAVWLMIGSYGTSSLVGGLLSIDRIRFGPIIGTSIASFGRFSMYSLGNSLGVLGLSSNDIFLLSMFHGPQVVAGYNAASVVFNFYLLSSEAMNMLLFPKSAEIVASGLTEAVRRARLTKLYTDWSQLFLILLTPVSVVLIIFAEPINRLLYGNQYPEVSLLLRIFAIWGLTMPVSRGIAGLLNGSNKPEVNMRLTWLLLLFSLSVNLVLIPKYSIGGAAIVVLLTALLALMLFMKTGNQEFGIRPTTYVSQLWRRFPELIGRRSGQRTNRC